MMFQPAAAISYSVLRMMTENSSEQAAGSDSSQHRAATRTVDTGEAVQGRREQLVRGGGLGPGAHAFLEFEFHPSLNLARHATPEMPLQDRHEGDHHVAG
jgi:hypothetical protein